MCSMTETTTSSEALGIKLVDIDKIDVGERRREELGEIEKLAESFKEWGQLHPITLTDGHKLVDGGRRLAAVKRIGWQQIEARYISSLREEELRELELQSTETAKNFTQEELNKRMIRAVQEAKEEIEEEKAQESFEQPVAQNSEKVSKRGRKGEGKPKSKKASQREIAKKTGMSQRTVSYVEQHTKAIEKYPDLERVYQRRQDILQNAKKLDEASDTDRKEALEVLATGQKITKVWKRQRERFDPKASKGGVKEASANGKEPDEQEGGFLDSASEWINEANIAYRRAADKQQEILGSKKRNKRLSEDDKRWLSLQARTARLWANFTSEVAAIQATGMEENLLKEWPVIALEDRLTDIRNTKATLVEWESKFQQAIEHKNEERRKHE